jgi:arylsulfatase
VDGLADLEILDNTLIYYILGDNGASAEGSLQGTFNEMITLQGFGHLETADYLRERIDKLGGVEAYNHYAVGWAHAMCTPYQWTKQVASHFGGTRNGTIVHWPAGIKVKGELRNQFHHVIDLAATVLEAAGLPQPLFVNGVQQKPLEGVSMLYSFNEKDAAERHETQYFEMIGNRGIYHKGWTAVTRHRTPWKTGAVQLPPFDHDVWELYDTNNDWSQARDLAQEQPEKLKELQRLWLIEATKYNVLPLDDRFAERANATLAGRPQLAKGKRQLLFGGMGRLSEGSIVDYKNASHAITAELEVPAKGADGVIVAVGGSIGGWALYAKAGQLRYAYNFFGLTTTIVEGQAIPPGLHQVRVEFAYDGKGIAKGGGLSLYLDGNKVGEGRIDQTEPFVFTADETFDIGFESGSCVTTDYSSNRFNGEVNWVQIDVGEDANDLDHFLNHQERLKIAMALH